MRQTHIFWMIPAAGLCLGASAAPSAPHWIEAPTYAQLAAVYPEKAKAEHVAGQATLSCTVAYSGRLSDCTTLQYAPAGYDFDGAARKLTPYMRVATGRGLSSGDEVRFTVTFVPEPAPGQPPLEDNPTWTAIPQLSDFQATFPKTENGVNHVRVVLACEVQAGGALSGCQVDSEEPAGQGYGAAALPLGPKFRVGLMTADGAPTVGAKVRVPIRYELTPEPAPKS